MGIVALKLGQKFEPEAGLSGFMPKAAMGLFVLGFVCLLGGLLHQVTMNRVALFRNGVAIEAEGAVRSARWDQIAHYSNCELGDPFRFQAMDGTELSIANETAGFGELGATIRQRAGECIFQREWQKLQNGGRAEFGMLTLTAEGLNYQGRSFPWSGIEKMYSHIINGRATLTFETSAFLGTGLRVPAEKIPSVHVCIRLIEQMAPRTLLVRA